MKVPRVSGKEMLNFLESIGFECIRIKGSHHVLRNQSGKVVVVPVHGNETLGIGLIRKILASADVSIQDFTQYMEGKRK